MKQLKEELQQRKLSTKGKKAVLAERLAGHLGPGVKVNHGWNRLCSYIVL